MQDIYHGSRDPMDYLYQTLAKLHPIQAHFTVLRPEKRDPFAPRFCWTFFRPDVDAFKRIILALDSYDEKNNIRWFFRGECIVALDPEFAKHSSAPVNSKLWDSYWPDDQFIERALMDLPVLCEHIEGALQLRDLKPKPFEYNFREPPPDSELIDFMDSGEMNNVWLVSNPKLFSARHSKDFPDAKLLHFSLSLRESNALTLVISNKPGVFPLLARFREFDLPKYDPSEIEPLRQECLLARTGTKEEDAIFGIDKLLLMCNWARYLGHGLYFQEL